jgi:tRNA pseudouridine13 synthase
VDLPFVTPDLPGVSGRIKAFPEDFRVDEIPLYPASGEGDHLFVRVEKTGKDSLFVARALARALGVSPREVGIAGQKDRHAVTTQWMSFPGVAPEAAFGLAGDGFRVLEAARHPHKLRTGHLKGNRFRIRLRDAEDLEGVERIARALEERGLANYYGEQRFGRSGENAALGRKILRGDPEAASVRDRRLKKLLVSAVQSEVFNRVLARRLREGSWATPLEGDVLQKLESGGLFVCETPEVEAPRVRSFECSITGPLPGPKMRPAPRGEPARLEEEAIREAGLGPEDFANRRDAPGARRPFRLPVRIGVERDAEGIVLDFELPAGAYATSLLREITKAS